MASTSKKETLICLINEASADYVIRNMKHTNLKELFITIENGKYIGIDNTTNDAWTEEFQTYSECLEYLLKDKEVPISLATVVSCSKVNKNGIFVNVEFIDKGEKCIVKNEFLSFPLGMVIEIKGFLKTPSMTFARDERGNHIPIQHLTRVPI